MTPRAGTVAGALAVVAALGTAVALARAAPGSNAVAATRPTTGPGPAVRTPVLVELFTSEGCSSCPQADAALAELARSQSVAGAEVVPLELHVDYWNRLGWTDPFSAPEFTERQETYARAFGEAGLFTPQAVVDGATSSVASARTLRAAVQRAAAAPKSVLRVSVAAARPGLDVSVEVPAGLDPGGVLVVALSEAGLSTRVEAGENAGRTLAHAEVARLLVDDGPGAGTRHVRLGVGARWRRERLRVVTFLQARDGRVLALGTAPVPAA